MTVCARNGQWTGLFVGLALLCAPSTGYTAASNIWQSTFGQNWFYESRSWPGQMLAGTGWEGLLEPGTTYEVRFEVNHLNGVAAVEVGERSIPINRQGWHAYDFSIWNGSKRRMRFTTRRQDVSAGIRNITVQPKWQSAAGSSGGSSTWLPKGHYLSFARERNLLASVLALVQAPHRAASNWHLGIAHDAHDALTTPGVQGFAMTFDWRTLEPRDGQYNWDLVDANMAAARQLGLKFIVKVGTRGFEGDDPTPGYFPNRYRIWTRSGGRTGFVAKIWDPWVSSRLIRLHRRIAARYANETAFGGIATTESALGNFSGANYSLAAYRNALQQIVTETQRSLSRGKLFWYLNFLRGDATADMRQDARVQILNNVPHHSLVVGASDITPDMQGMPGSVNSYRVHVRNTRANLEQFCHAQHIDQGLGGVNRKSNQHRGAFAQLVQRLRRQEQQPWHNGPRGTYVFDDLRDPNGRRVDLHPNWVLGQLWNPRELFDYANRNFDCDYFFWHYRENVYNLPTQFWWEDIRPVITSNQGFHRS